MKTPDPTSRQFFEEKYRARLDPGCSIGVLTELLADRCDHVCAIDIAETAVAAERPPAGRVVRSDSSITQ